MVRSDIVQMYKGVHTWVGIISGLFLFIAFYAGAITMFEEPLQRWATPPTDLAQPVPLADAPRLIDAAIASHPDVAQGYTVNVETGPDRPARLEWTVWPEGRGRGAPQQTYAAAFGTDGSLQTQRQEPAPLAQFIDTLHQHVGLPFPPSISLYVMGIVALLYFMALVSGVIVLLPSLVKDLFALRLGRNLKRMWLDVHNVLGIFSLPFHIIMALTALIFAFHDPIYDAQDRLAYGGQIEAMFEANETPHDADVREGVAFAAPATIAATLAQSDPDFTLRWITYRTTPDGKAQIQAAGTRDGYGLRGPTFGYAMMHPYSGAVMAYDYMPGHQQGYLAAITSFFALHFGNFGGNPIRWAYFALGLGGAFLFYSGNIMWIETRRRKQRKGNPVEQRRDTRILGALTVGVSLGCVVGISLTVAAAKLLPALAGDAVVEPAYVYYPALVLSLALAFTLGPARGAVALLAIAAAAFLTIPGASLVSSLLQNGWNYGGTSLVVDGIAVLGSVAALAMMVRTLRRIRSAPEDSIWFAPSRAGHAL